MPPPDPEDDHEEKPQRCCSCGRAISLFLSMLIVLVAVLVAAIVQVPTRVVLLRQVFGDAGDICAWPQMKPDGNWCRSYGICVSPELCATSVQVRLLTKSIDVMRQLSLQKKPDHVITHYIETIDRTSSKLTASSSKRIFAQFDLQLRRIRQCSTDVYIQGVVASGSVATAVMSVEDTARRATSLFQNMLHAVETQYGGSRRMIDFKDQFQVQTNSFMKQARDSEQLLSTARFDCGKLQSVIYETTRQIQQGQTSIGDLQKEVDRIQINSDKSTSDAVASGALTSVVASVAGCAIGSIVGPAGCFLMATLLTKCEMDSTTAKVKMINEAKHDIKILEITNHDQTMAPMQSYLELLDGEYKTFIQQIELANSKLKYMQQQVTSLLAKEQELSNTNYWALLALIGDAQALQQQATIAIANINQESGGRASNLLA